MVEVICDYTINFHRGDTKSGISSGEGVLVVDRGVLVVERRVLVVERGC